MRPHARQVPLAVPFGRRIQTRGSVRGWLASAALHAAVVVLAIWGGREIYRVEGPPGFGPGRGGGGGGGGNRTFAILIPSAAAAMPVPPPIALPSQLTVPVQEVRIPETEVRAPTAAELVAQPVTGSGPGQGEGQGTGAGPGQGSGTGGGIGSGRGSGVGSDSGGSGRIFPPQPQTIILPPTGAPSGLRGVRLTVEFDISERGEVLGVSVNPPIRDRGYREEFMRRMRSYVFTPAMTPEGRPVRALYPVGITL
jgi:hypothetical protein